MLDPNKRLELDLSGILLHFSSHETIALFRRCFGARSLSGRLVLS